MKYDEQVAFLQSIHGPRLILGLAQDVSQHPEWFRNPIRIRGFHIHGRAYSDSSKTLGTLELDVILYNETFKENVSPPDDYLRVRVRDTQQYVYQAAVRIPPPPKRFPWLSS